MNNRCLDCGKMHESWGASSICCEPTRTNKRADADSRCVVCNRFTPRYFGCHGEFLADYTDAIKKRAAYTSKKKVEVVKSDRLVAKLSRNEQKARRTTFIEMI